LSPIANLFWNARERRVRAGWRLLVFLNSVCRGRGRWPRGGRSGGAPDLLMSMRKNRIWAFYRYAAEFDPSQLSRPGESLAVEIR
jgi:hypothetical protein